MCGCVGEYVCGVWWLLPHPTLPYLCFRGCDSLEHAQQRRGSLILFAHTPSLVLDTSTSRGHHLTDTDTHVPRTMARDGHYDEKTQVI